MSLSSAFKICLAAILIAASTGLRATKARKLQQHESILSYQPLSQVTDIAAIDLDQVALESMLPLGTNDAMAQALSIYTMGGFSASFAKLTLNIPISTAIDFDVPIGTLVSGTAFEKGIVRGELMKPLTGGHSEVFVKYAVGDEQRSYVGCQVGGSPNPILDGCFASVGEIVIGNPADILTFTFTYEYDVLEDNQNARTLQSLSTSAKANLYDCANCPYSTYQKFYDYYGQFDYGNEWIMAAFNRSSTDFVNGNADFSRYAENSTGIVEAIDKGTVLFNVYMEVIKSMEQALDKCAATPDEESIKSWDEAVALYVGSMSKVTNGEDGNFLYTNAKKRCRNFGTCDSDDGGDGEAASNVKILEQFAIAQTDLVQGECESARQAKNRIIDLMSIPLVQGTLRFAFLMGREGIIDERSDVTSATFAASILPLVHSCSPEDAQIIYSNMKVGAVEVNFIEVKSSLERNYGCMGLTCSDIGGLLSESNDGYMEGAEPCDDAAAVLNDVTEADISTTSAVETEAADTDGTSNVTATLTATEAPTTDAPTYNNNTESAEALSPECPPCSHIPLSELTAASKSFSSECSALVEQQKGSIGKGCACACFVNSEFAFCAQESITYTGSGTIVGPCVVELPENLIEAEEETTGEDFNNEAGDEETMDDESDLDVSFAQDESSASAAALRGIVASVLAALSTALL